LELELKLLIAPEDVRKIERHPALRAVTRSRPRLQRLHSVYWDTADSALAQAGASLRIRRIGTGDRAHFVQTLKAAGGSAAGLHERVELEWPVSRAKIDGALLLASPLAKLLRKSGVLDRGSPIFATSFARRARRIEFADGTCAEFAIDAGELRAGSHRAPISEIEIELANGDPARLFELAATLARDVPLRVGHASKAERGYRLAQGSALPAPHKMPQLALDEGMPAAAAARRIVLGCIAHMQAHEDGVLRGRNPEYLHQMRTALRRLRTALKLLRKLAPVDALSAIDAELRWLAAVLGPARDWDVFLSDILAPLERTLPPEDDLAALHRLALRLRARHARSAREALRAPRYQMLLLSLGRTFATDGLPLLRNAAAGDGSLNLDAPAQSWASAILAKAAARLRKRGGPSLPEATPSDRHRARIAAKRLRYAAEFFASLYPAKRVARYIGALQELQRVLGILNDAAVAERLLDEALSTAKTPIEPKVVGLVRGWTAAMGAQQVEALARSWRAFEKARPFWGGR
jgi:triphosphatase